MSIKSVVKTIQNIFLSTIYILHYFLKKSTAKFYKKILKKQFTFLRKLIIISLFLIYSDKNVGEKRFCPVIALKKQEEEGFG
jgi:hypothetical protein